MSFPLGRIEFVARIVFAALPTIVDRRTFVMTFLKCIPNARS